MNVPPMPSLIMTIKLNENIQDRKMNKTPFSHLLEKTVKLTTHFQFKLTTSFGAK